MFSVISPNHLLSSPTLLSAQMNAQTVITAYVCLTWQLELVIASSDQQHTAMQRFYCSSDVMQGMLWRVEVHHGEWG